MIGVGGKQRQAQAQAQGRLEFLQERETVWRMLVTLALERKGADTEAAQRFAQAQYRNIYGEFARSRIETTVPLTCSPGVRKMVLSNIIRWAKSRAAG